MKQSSRNFRNFSLFLVASFLAIFGLLYIYNWGRNLSRRVDDLAAKLETSQTTVETVPKLRQEIDRLTNVLASIRSETPKPPTRVKIVSVREIQGMLKILGYYSKDVDGLSGPSTTKAVRDFQRSNGMEVNGHVEDVQFVERLREQSKIKK
jgi:hypothetical protein